MGNTVSELADVYYRNAMNLIHGERRAAKRIDHAYRILVNLGAGDVKGSISDWLKNPFAETAVKILEKFEENYRVREALKLLKEARAQGKK